MRNLKALYLAAAAMCAATPACDAVSSAVMQSEPRPLSPPAPHRCAVCNGTGSITQSFEQALPATITACQLEATGFLGLGSNRVATVSVRNDGDQAGMFTITVTGNYPGGGHIEHVRDNRVWIEAHRTATKREEFAPHDGMGSVQCRSIAPNVVQQRTAICTVCSGRGMVQ